MTQAMTTLSQLLFARVGTTTIAGVMWPFPIPVVMAHSHPHTLPPVLWLSPGVPAL